MSRDITLAAGKAALDTRHTEREWIGVRGLRSSTPAPCLPGEGRVKGSALRISHDGIISEFGR